MRFIMTLLIALGAITASAQDKSLTVRGKVTDASTTEPVAYAAVHLEGTTIGVSADAEGNYVIMIPSNGTLVFSSIGYKTKEVAAEGRMVINVSIEPDSEYLDETIVIAYGTATKSSFTGSASMVDAQTIESRVSTNVTDALAGTTPGVQIISSSGDPASSGATVRIRGIGSMSASNSPLYIVDGMPFDGAISDINPNDVESMSVLKDASASAIYGARGANGVILITTKRASGNSDAKVRFDAKWGSNSRLIPQYDVIDDPALYYETHYKMMYNSQVYSGKSPAEAYAYADANLFNQNNGGLGYQVFTVPDGEKFIVNRPSWRSDISGAHDLVEEVLRIHGYDKLPATTLPRPNGVHGILQPKQKREVSVRRALANRGGYQTITWSFMSSAHAKLFRKAEAVLLANPISSDLN